ncbi:MAG: DUF2891 domain-containing protein [Crocinitomicaceae bacterium]
MGRSSFATLLLLLSSCVYHGPDDDISIGNKKVSLILDDAQATRLAALPMKCLDQEYPNKLNQVLADSTELQRPKALHPAFYGCFDWHSSVHGHWMLVRLLHEFPKMDQQKIRKELYNRLSSENIAVETAYFESKYNNSFERTYGWAWILKLHGELLTLNDSLGKQLSANMNPLASLMVKRYEDFLPKLSHPLRSGEHINTAFGLSMAFDYAVQTKNTAFKKLIVERAKAFYLNDEDANLDYEPSGFDFLSPIFEEIHLMCKVLPRKEFNAWLYRFLPILLNPRFTIEPAVVTDRSDGKLVHLDGLNLSRAWCMYAIARSDKKLHHLRRVADKHLKSSLPSIVDGDYMGEHWLASFALYALLERKIK